MNKVLVVSPFFPPFSKVGATKRIENFVRYLPALQWEPLVLAMHWGHAELSEHAHNRMFYTRNIAYASWKAYQTADISKSVSWKSLFMKKIIGLLRAIKKYVLVPDELVLWIFWAVPKARQILKQEKPDVILVTAPPYSSLLTAVIRKKILKVPLVCDVRDDWVENPLIEKDSRLLRRIEAHMERWVVRNAEVATKRMQSYNTNLAAEFYVLSMLHRIGAGATLTLGNKKSVDIAVVKSAGNTVTIDVKGLAGRTAWPVDNVNTPKKSHFIVFVCFLGKISDPMVTPEVYVVP